MRNENTYVGHWNSYVRIPMSNIGIPTWVFQLQPRNSEAREPTNVGKNIGTLQIDFA